jgi:hypothetical protein
VLSPVLAHVTPPLGHLSPSVPFDELLDRLRGYVTYTPLHNAAGAPAISLPIALSEQGLPIGVQLSGAYGDERTLLEVAYALEAAAGWPRIQDQLGAPASPVTAVDTSAPVSAGHGADARTAPPGGDDARPLARPGGPGTAA